MSKTVCWLLGVSVAGASYFTAAASLETQNSLFVGSLKRLTRQLQGARSLDTPLTIQQDSDPERDLNALKRAWNRPFLNIHQILIDRHTQHKPLLSFDDFNDVWQRFRSQLPF